MTLRIAALLKAASLAALAIAQASLAQSVDTSPHPQPRLIRPEVDPFYAAPGNLTSYPLGAVIDYRPTETANLGLLASNVKATYQFLYRSEDQWGGPQANVLTVMQPYGLDPKAPPRILSYQTAEDSAAMHCAPSYQLQAGGFDATNTPLEQIFMNHGLQSGYVVVAPDYEGPKSAFTNGEIAGRGVLDALRAVLSFEPIVPADVKEQAKVALMGYSGGSLASNWALQLQPEYAPELGPHLVGIATGGNIISSLSVLLTINKSPFSGLGFSGFAGHYSSNEGFREWAEEHVTPRGKAILEDVLSQCSGKTLVTYNFQDVFSHSDQTQDETLADPRVRAAFASGHLGLEGTPVSKVPRYYFQGMLDEIAGIADTDAYVASQCRQGARIRYERELVGTHVILSVTGASAGFDFLRSRFEGDEMPEGCTTRDTLTSTLAPEALKQFGQVALHEVQALLDLPQGPGLANVLLGKRSETASVHGRDHAPVSVRRRRSRPQTVHFEP